MSGNLIESWLASYSPTTVPVYLSAMKELARFLGTADAAAAVEVLIAAGEMGTNEHLVAWRSAREAAGASSSTVAGGIAAVRSVLRLAKRVGRISWTCDVRAPRVHAVKDSSGPSIDEVREMMRTARSHANARTAARDAALVALLAGCGLRRAEVLALDLEHVEAGAMAIHATCKGKRGRDRIELPAAVREALAAWIAQHPVGRGALFVGVHRGARSQGFPRLSGSALHLAMARLALNSGIERPVRPHGFRHSFASTALDVARGASYRVAKLTRHVDDKGVHWYDDKKRAKQARGQSRLASRVADRILGQEGTARPSAWRGSEGPTLFDALPGGGEA